MKEPISNITAINAIIHFENAVSQNANTKSSIAKTMPINFECMLLPPFDEYNRLWGFINMFVDRTSIHTYDEDYAYYKSFRMFITK